MGGAWDIALLPCDAALMGVGEILSIAKDFPAVSPNQEHEIGTRT